VKILTNKSINQSIRAQKSLYFDHFSSPSVIIVIHKSEKGRETPGLIAKLNPWEKNRRKMKELML
jgi:hypothetical protein